MITGAAVRIGREIALTLASRGASIVIHYHDSAKPARQLAQEIEMLGARAFLISADFSHRVGALVPSLQEFVRNVERAAGKIDVLINNAAIFYPTPFGKIVEKDWDAFLTTNLKAPFFIAQEFGKKMAARKSGKIVNLVDWTALRPAANYLPYAISKAGLWAATTGLAKALAPHVQVAGIAPGPILPAKGSSAKEQKQVASKTLLKRFGHPREIAQAIRFFIEDTDFVTGAMIPVEGGASLV